MSLSTSKPLILFIHLTNLSNTPQASQIHKDLKPYLATLMEATKQSTQPNQPQQPPQQVAVNTAQPATSISTQESSTSGVTNVDELTRAELRSYELIRIEKPEEDIDPDYRHYLRAIGAYDSVQLQYDASLDSRSQKGNWPRIRNMSRTAGMDTPPYDQPQENTGGHPQKRKRNRPRGSRMKSKVHLINDRSTFKPKYYDCECDDCDSYIKQKNARNMRKAILLSKRISARSQDAASPQQTRIIRHTRTKKRGAYS
ncbi:hypothetical protein Bca52824_054075 [Brassica carinata]|uniref:Uncharacterized protein n=1 Tax=Brassica carinata TaxID=52824 RepID=A0A8X7UK63_BRACI|nr:hypothetical protein Bca52824_054075 [Brassica carinata]